MSSNPNVPDVSLIPTGQLNAVTQNVASNGTNNPNVSSVLKSLQDQINTLMGQQITEELPDVVLVNPGGRIVAVSGRNSAEYLAKAGFRKATPEEEAAHNKATLYQTQEFLKRMEAKRIRDEKNFIDNLENEGELEKAVNPTSLLRTTVTNAQKTGALEPSEVAKLNASVPTPTVPTDPSATLSNDTAGNDVSTNTNNIAPPPSRKSNKK